MKRGAWLAAMIPTVVIALVTCTNHTSTSTTDTDSGASTGGSGESFCPDVAPKPGDGCVLPEGTTCSFDVCGASIARCSQGVWRFGGNVETPTCPTDFPTSQAACPTCFPADLRCNYGSTDCTAPDASTNRSVASCPKGTWVIATFPCSDASASTLPDAATDAPADAGADVQGDGSPETG